MTSSEARNPNPEGRAARGNDPDAATLPICLRDLRDLLHRHLMQHVMPFWLEHSGDDAGGINTCLDDEGRLISRDKWMWSQWRAVWVFSHLYDSFGHESVWLDLADHVMSFCIRHGWLESEQAWAFRLDASGAVIDGYESISVDAFAIYGLNAYYQVTGSDAASRWARRTADALISRLQRPHDQLPHAPYPVPDGARMHGIPMICSLVLWELGQSLGEDRYREAAVGLSQEVFAHFYDPARDVVLERIGADGKELPPPLGSTVVPGHVIEDMWFQAHIAGERSDTVTLGQCWPLIRRHLELGWDAEHGGLLLAIDADGRADVGWRHPDAKLWWPHTEALYALLLAYEHSRQPWCLDWYERIHDYAFNHFPHPAGDWRQKLNRQGQPLEEVVALPVKDPFHLPRALMLSVGALDRMLKDES